MNDGNKTQSNGYEYVNHPNHYNEYSIEVIDMFERIYGAQKTADRS